MLHYRYLAHHMTESLYSYVVFAYFCNNLLSFCSDTSYFERHIDTWQEPYFQRTWDTDKWIITADGMASLMFSYQLSIIMVIFYWIIFSSLYVILMFQQVNECGRTIACQCLWQRRLLLSIFHLLAKTSALLVRI